jgi:hypothetical protein
LELKNRKMVIAGDTKKRSAFRAAMLAGSLALAPSCTPDITVNNIPYDPNATDASTDCKAVTSCSTLASMLREPGNSAGPNTMEIDSAMLTLDGIEDSGSTKAADLRLTACGQEASYPLKPTETVVLTAGDDSIEVTVESMDYDAAGLRVRVSVTPVCPDMDGGSSDGGAGGSG